MIKSFMSGFDNNNHGIFDYIRVLRFLHHSGMVYYILIKNIENALG
jgi:hypothetical protein